MRKVIFVAVTCAFMSATASAGVWNTGVDGTGTPLADGIADGHYTLTTVPSGPSSAIAIAEIPQWLSPVGAKWIGPTVATASDPAGVYVYTMETFTLPDPGYILSGNWATDNAGEILLNGVSTGITTEPEDFTSLTPFSIVTGFQTGTNTLAFRVTNGAPGVSVGPTGLLVSDLQLNVIPVPGAVLLGILGLGVAGLKLRKSA